MVVVGAVDIAGKVFDLSRTGQEVNVYAPGVKIECVDPGVILKTGTEYAAALVAGLAVYFLSTIPTLQVVGQTAALVLQKLQASKFYVPYLLCHCFHFGHIPDQSLSSVVVKEFVGRVRSVSKGDREWIFRPCLREAWPSRTSTP